MFGTEVIGMPVMKIEGRSTLGVTGVPNDSSMLFLIWYLYGAMAILLTIRGTYNMSGAKVRAMPTIPFQGQQTLRVTIVAYDSCILFLIWWLWRALATTLSLGGKSNMFGAKMVEMPVMTLQS